MLEKQAEDFRKMRSGDMKAFERLFVSLYPGLCNIANHYLNNEMLSKDVAQDAFIKWWNKREDFRDFAAVKSFLYITIRNQCLISGTIGKRWIWPGGFRKKQMPISI